MKEAEDDDRTVMVGASFDEIAAEASAAVKREIDRQVQEVAPYITQALTDSAVALREAASALVAAQGRARQYRFVLLVLLALCGVEGGVLTILMIHR